jgi:hypothetical protein
MTRIVSGRFDTLAKAEQAVSELNAAGCRAEEVNLFFNPPPGQHGVFPIGGDEHADPEAKGAERKALTGAAIGAGIGGLAGAVAGPVGAIAGAAVGGYTGSLAGTLSGLGNEGESERRPSSGVVVAVRADRAIGKDGAMRILRQAGADPVECIDGQWRGGEWTDFDPVAPSHDAAQDAGASGRASFDRPQIVYRVFPGGHGKWNVFEGDLGKLLSEFPGRQEALDYAESLARMKELAVVELYRAGGVLESSRVYSNADQLERKTV